MTDKYILTIDGGKENAFTKEYTREELEAKKDYIAQTYAGRYRVDAIGAADTSSIDDNASYTVKFNDSDFSKTYTGAEFKAKRDYLEQNYAGRYDVETSVGSWDDMSQVFAPSLREQLDTFRMENRDFMNDIENRIDTNIQAARMGGGGTAAAFGRQADSLEVTDEDWTRYNELVKQEEELKRAYYTSDEYLKEQNEKAYMMAQMRDQIGKDRLAYAQAHPMLATQHTATRGAEADAEMQMFETAGRIMDDAIKLQNAPSRYTPKGTGFRNMRKGAGDKASDIDLWTAGLSEITDNLGVRGVLSKVQAKLGNLNNLSEEAIESILTPAEKAVLQAWAINAQTQMARAEDLSRGYQAGQGAVESLAFMAEFALTGGVGKAASEGAETFAKWLGKKVTGSADEIVEEAAKEVAEKAGEGIVKKYGKNLGLSLAEAAGRTGVMPSTFRNISEKATEINEDEDGNRTIVSMNNAFAKGLADSFIETLSEGGRVSALGSLVGDVAGKIPAYAKLTHWLSNTKAADIYNAFQSSGIMNSLRAGGWHGIFEEYLEEWYGNALRTLTHVDKDALKDFATVDNQLVTITSFLPLTIFGGTVSTAQVMKSRKQLSKASDMLKTALMDRAYSEEQANEQIDMLMGATPQQVSDYLTPIINQEEEANEEAGSKMAIIAANFTKALVKWQSYNTKYRYQEQEQRDAVRANLLQATGGKSFWMTDEDGNETVQRATNDKGEVVFVMSKPTAEDRRVSGITPDGRIVFFNDGEYQLENEKTMNDFLHGEVMAEKADKEKARMLEEKDAAIREIKAASAPGAQVTLGTVEAPIPGIIRQRLADGVIIETPEGIQHMTYEQLGNYIGINATPMTDEQIDEQQSDTMLAEDAQREAELDMEYDDVAAAEVHEEETIAEVESALKDDKPLPLDSEGEVDEEALWNEDPGKWAAWNDERKQDGGHDSFSALFHAKNTLEQEIAQMEKEYKLTFVGKKRNALAQEIEAKKQRYALLDELVDEYAIKIERQLMEKYAAEERAKAAQEAPAQEQAALSALQAQMTEQQMDEMDAQYEGIYSQTRSLNERARLLQEYLDKIAEPDIPAVVLTSRDYDDKMKAAGCSDYAIMQVRDALYQGGTIEGFMVDGKVFLMVEGIPSIDKGRQKYIHEAQHTITPTTDFVARLLATGISRDTLRKYVRALSGGYFYENKSIGVLADEFISFAIEYAYTNTEFSLDLQRLGVDEEAINFIQTIYNEQQGKYFNLAGRRKGRDAHVSSDRPGSSRENDRDLGQVSSGLLGSQRDGSAENSARGAGDREGGEGAAEPAVDDEINPAFVEAISTDAEGAKFSVKLTDSEIDNLVEAMKANAEVAEDLELTPENWEDQFGTDGMVPTPVGNVKMGENQYLKLLQRKRNQYFGMIRPTLVNPDIVLEELSPSENGERDTVLLFIKTFIKPDGSRYVHFESVTIQKDSMEISISSHEIQEGDLKKKMRNDKVAHLRDSLSASEWRLNGRPLDGSDLVPTPSDNLSDSKDSENLETPSESERFSVSAVRIDPDANQQAEGNVMFSTRRGSLVGMHNISEEKLRKLIKQGGSANPSTAVIDIERQSFDSYGDISLIMPSSLVDAETGRNAGTFTADAWTPTYPQIEKRFSDDNLQRAYWRDITAIPEEMQHEVRMAFDSWLDNRTASGLAYMYLLERGEAPEMVRVAAKFPQEIKDKMSAILGEGRTGFYELTDEEKQAVLDLYIQKNFGGSREDFDSSIAETIQRIEDRLSTGKVPSFVEKRITADLQWMKEHGYNYDNLSDFVRDIVSDIRHAGEVNDAATTNRALDYIKDNNLSAEYEQWKESLNDRYGIKEYLFDGYTPSGNPRWLPNTVENASKLMNKQGLAGATGMASSFNRFVATLAPKKKSLSDIRSSKDLLVEDEKLVDDFRDKWSEVFFDLGIKCQPDAKGYEDYGLARLTEAAQKKNPGAYLKKEYGIELSQEDLQKLADMIKAIKTEFPARYFETKFQRPVYLNEFTAAVMPTTTSADIKQAIAEAGLPIFEYDSSADGARREATLKATDIEGVRFSVRESSMDEIDSLFHDYNGDKSLEPLYDKVSALAHTMSLKIKFDNPWSNAAGTTVADKVKFNSMFMDSPYQPAEKKAHAILHELIHATTQYAIQAKKAGLLTEDMTEAVNQLDNIYNEIKADPAFEGMKGVESVHEMVAELANPEFRATLKEKNLFRQIVDAIKRLLGIETGENALDNLSSTLDYILENFDADAYRKYVDVAQRNERYIRFSIANENQAIFVSNAARAVDAIKMEKATPEQWLKMIEKNGGLKAGEDKWMGLSDWLKESDRKTLTKAEVLEFVNEHMIKIEEVHYIEGSDEDFRETAEDTRYALQEIYDDYIAESEEMTDDMYMSTHYDYAIQKLAERLGYEAWNAPFVNMNATIRLDLDSEFAVAELNDIRKRLGIASIREERAINETRLEYTTNGLVNLHEIALTVPTIESWHESDEIHFGDAGNGRAVAWVRFGETTATVQDETQQRLNEIYDRLAELEMKVSSSTGITHEEYEERSRLRKERDELQEIEPKTQRVLVIDEIQSKRHQEGREKGYARGPKVSLTELRQKAQDFEQEMIDKYHPKDLGLVPFASAMRGVWTEEESNTYSEMMSALGRAAKKNIGIPDAPFDKNWHELAMKRMLRYAAENGYDVIAWTKGEQQAERYNIGSYVSSIEMQEEYDGKRDFGFYMGDADEATTVTVDENGTVVSAEGHLSQAEGRPLADLVGKDMAVKMMQMEEYDVLEDTDLKVGNEGMKGFYDRMLPAFMNKYGKKWGVKVADITLPNVEEAGRVMHSVPVTDAMKESVMEGQVMFSAVQIDPAVRQEMDTIKAKAMWDGTFMKAPNGAETKLTEDQWLLVRTNNFKNWFGDWENDPENASKVVDENGEPMVMYHGSAWEPLMEPKGKAVFRMNDGLLGRGAYFSNELAEATLYAEIATDLDTTEEGNYELLQDKYVTDYFLNVRNEEDIFREGNDMVAVAKSPSQIKSATETTGEFSESDDIRYSSRFDVNTNPTEAQKKAGNYKMGHLRLDGYNITIENPKGSVRRGTDSKGNEWENTLNNDYGYIRGTEGVDGDHIDVYLSDNPAEGNVFVIDQVNPETREFDEHKVMYGFNSMDEAREAYLANFSEGWNGLGTITEVTKDEFKKWIDSSHRKTKPFSEYKSVKADILDEGDIRYSLVTDPATLERLENEPTIKVYRAMQLIDGKLYPPMSAKVDGKMREPIELGKWEQAEERPDLADEKGYFKLDKGNKTSLKARYNPYFHTSPTPLNDQFSSAQTRPELVTVEVEVPESELTSGYKAEKAKDSVGQMEWKAGVVQSRLSGTRTVILSRWDKPIRIVPDSEVADKIVEMFDGKDITMPSNVVTPSLRAELESRGIPFVETDNNGKPVEADTRYSVLSTPTDEIVAEGMKFSIQDFARLAGNIFQDMPESFRKEAIEETFKRGWDMQSAIFQIPARLAEKESWDETDKDLAKVIRDKVQDAMDESGVVMSRPLTDKEALWMLYRSTEANGDSMMDAAKRAMVAYNLGFDKETLAREDEAKEDVRFSAVRSAKADATARLYNKSATFWWSRIKESLVDMYASVEGLVKAIEKTSGKKAKGFENIIMALNQQPSKGLAAMKKYTKKYLEPMLDEISAVMKAAGKTYDDVVRYVILKHGLERNEAFAKRDAKEYWTNFFGKVDSYMKSKSHAQLVVALSEAKAKVKELEEAIMMGETGKKQALIDAQTELQIVELALRGDEKQNEADLDAKLEAIDNGADAKYKEFRKNDYSGITSMFYDQLEVNRSDFDTEEEYQEAIVAARTEKFKTLKQVEDAATKEVEEFEDAANTDRLWKKINASTKEILRQQYEASMISKEQYDTLREMFKFYVPLRGFKDNTAEDMYTYYRKPNSIGYTKPNLAAEGRKTEAESPFGWIASMASSAIASNVKNEARLALYYFIANRPDNGLATLSKTWYKYSHTDLDSGKRVFVPAYPEGLTSDMTAEEAKKAIDAWHEEMEQARKEGKAYESGQKLSLGDSVVNIEEKNRPEHAVNVKVSGKDYTIFINGNPRAAQAINGDLNVETQGDYSKVFGPLLRWMSSVNTSYNPEFWVTNMQRDLLFTIMAVSTKEDPAYRRRFAANYMKAFKVISMAAKNEEGLLGDSEIEALYKEFVDNGGVTGYTQIKDNETWEQEIANYMKSQDLEDQKMGAALKKMRDGFHALHRFGESLEQVSRFAAFMTSRQMGRSMQESINDAKEITVNFNRKGSGKWISPEEAKTLTDRKGRPINKFQRWIAVGLTSIAPAGRRFIMFFNAAIQGLDATVKLYRKNPDKMFLLWTLGYFSLGVMQALLHDLLDDDDDYLDMPQYERRNSLMLGGNGFYFKWALPQEARMFYALGDLFVEEMLGRNPQKAFDEGSTLGQAITAVTEILPINPFEGWRGLLPSVAVPYVELVANEDYKGTPIYNEQKWAGDDEADRTAKWSRAYEGTGTMYVGLSRLLNAMTGGDKHDAGFINLQPEKLEHIVQSSFGGTLRTIDKFVSTILAAVDQYLPGEADEKITMRQAPFLNRLFTINDERFKNAHVNELYGYYAAEAEHVMKLRKNYIKDKEKAKKEALDKTEEAKWVPIYKKYKKPIEKKQEQIRMAKSGPERQRLMKEQDVLKKRMIKEISEIR